MRLGSSKISNVDCSEFIKETKRMLSAQATQLEQNNSFEAKKQALELRKLELEIELMQQRMNAPVPTPGSITHPGQ